MNTKAVQELFDDLYQFNEAGAAVDVDGFRLHINATDEGLIVDIYDAAIAKDGNPDMAHLDSVMAEHCDREDPDVRLRRDHVERLGDAQYELVESTAAFEIEGFRIHVISDREGLTVDLFDAGPILEREDYESARMASRRVDISALTAFQVEKQDAMEASLAPSSPTASGPSPN